MRPVASARVNPSAPCPTSSHRFACFVAPRTGVPRGVAGRIPHQGSSRLKSVARGNVRLTSSTSWSMRYTSITARRPERSAMPATRSSSPMRAYTTLRLKSVTLMRGAPASLVIGSDRL